MARQRKGRRRRAKQPARGNRSRGSARKVARKPALKRLRAPASRAVEAALAGIAHEIRTPLTGILALAELLATSDLGERERQWANAVKSGAEHLSALTTLIVDAVKADAVGLAPRRAPFSPRRLAELIGQSLSARAGIKGLAADVVIDAEMPASAVGDETRLRAALENLADNAVKFTERGTVALRVGAALAARSRMRLTFSFTDSGVGLTTAEAAQLFEPFVQANVDVAQRFGGAGLGLVFVRRIAKAMGGGLKVTSAPGCGSTFTLTALVDISTVPAQTEAAMGIDRRGLQLLCVEDNPYGRVVMNTILTELGHRVDFVGDGVAAIEAVASGRYDAVLMDLTLPSIDGCEATRRIRALSGAAGRTPVIGVSGRSGQSAEDAARVCGMDAYLAKPVSPAQLARVLAGIVP